MSEIEAVREVLEGLRDLPPGELTTREPEEVQAALWQAVEMMLELEYVIGAAEILAAGINVILQTGHAVRARMEDLEEEFDKSPSAS